MKLFSILVAGSMVVMTACKEKPESKTQAEGQEPTPKAVQPSVPVPVFTVPDTFRAALGKVYEGYTQIQTALAQDDLPKAKEAFNGMHAVLHMMPKDGLDTAAKAYWDSADARIMAALHPMATSGSIDSVRTHFMAFSEVMVEVVEKFGMSGDSPVYQFHCPMANHNQGADWLQKGREVENPYFGKSMPKCGNLVRTLKG